MAREVREIYRGKATIKAVVFEGVEDWKEWERRDLSDADKTNAFKIVYEVTEGETGGGAVHEIKIECSHRELKGKMLTYYAHEDGSTPTQLDVAVRSLVGQGILTKGAKPEDLTSAIDDSHIGRIVTIRAFEELGADGEHWWPRCVFASERRRITGDDRQARIAAFFSGKAAPTPAAQATATATVAMPPAPADDDEMPF